MKRAFVTGAGGFIGSHLVEALAARGVQTKALVHYNSAGNRGWLEELPEKLRGNVEIVAGDIRDGPGIRHLMKDADTVFHLAALIAIPYSYDQPFSYVDTNVTGTFNVLQAARDLEVPRLVVTSTSEVYGSAQVVPITEEHRLHPQSPYAASKVGADQLALSFYRSFGLPVTVFRPFNTFGPRQSARAILPSVITQLLSGTERISLGALHPTRDFMFALDTAQAFIAAAESPNTIGEVVHAGSGMEISIGDVVKLLMELCASNAKVELDPKRLRPCQSEVTRLLAANDKMTRLTNWRPEFTGMPGLRRGLEQTVAWFKDPAHLSRYKSELYAV